MSQLHNWVLVQLWRPLQINPDVLSTHIVRFVALETSKVHYLLSLVSLSRVDDEAMNLTILFNQKILVDLWELPNS